MAELDSLVISAALAAGMFCASSGHAMRHIDDAGLIGQLTPRQTYPELSNYAVSLHASDPAYQWLQSLPGNHILAESVKFSIRFPRSEGLDQTAQHTVVVSTIDQINAYSSAAKGGGFSGPIIPEPPTDGRPGETFSMKMFCQSMTIGTFPRIADIEYVWEWQNRVDSDNDGEKDSDPGWVLTDVKIKFLPEVSASFCQ